VKNLLMRSVLSCVLGLGGLLAGALPVVADDTGAAVPAASPAFRITGQTVDADAARPSVCVSFSAPLDLKARAGFRQLLDVTPSIQIAAWAWGNQLCVSGFEHGKAYRLTVKSGLPSENGSPLAESQALDVEIPDRAPQISFHSSGFVQPVASKTIPLRVMNLDRVHVQLFRAEGPALIQRLLGMQAAGTLNDVTFVKSILPQLRSVWSGAIATGAIAAGGGANRLETIDFPFAALTRGPNDQASPGLYLVMARGYTGDLNPESFHWMAVSDLSLTALAGDTGLKVFAFSASDQKPLHAASVILASAAGDALATAVTDDQGVASIPTASLAKDSVPAYLSVLQEGGQIGFLSLSGRNTLAASEQVIEPVFLQKPVFVKENRTVAFALALRGQGGVALTSRKLYVTLTRPDGFVVDAATIDDQGNGVYAGRLRAPAHQGDGAWSLKVMDDPAPQAMALAESTVLFQAEEPSGVTASLETGGSVVPADGQLNIRLRLRAKSSDDTSGADGMIRLSFRPMEKQFDGVDSYNFCSDDGVEQKLQSFTTDEDGVAVLSVSVPGLLSKKCPQMVDLQVLAGTAATGDPDQTIAYYPGPFSLGLHPRFAGDTVPEGKLAGFDVVALDSSGKRTSPDGVTYTIYEERSSYDWFQDQGRWDFKTKTQEYPVAGGAVVFQDRKASIEDMLKPGRYRVELVSRAGTGKVSANFRVARAMGDVEDLPAPDKLRIENRGQDVASGTVHVFVQPPYPATVLLAVAGGAVQSVKTVTITEKGALVDLPVAADSGAAGVHILGEAFGENLRASGSLFVPIPRDTAEKVDLMSDIPQTAETGSELRIPVQVSGLSAGQTVRLLAVAQAVEAGDDRADGKPLKITSQPLPHVRVLDGLRRDAGGKPAPRQVRGAESTDFLSMTTEMVADKNGTVWVSLPILGAEGGLRVRIFGVSKTSLASTEGRVVVRPALSLRLDAPDILMKGDLGRLQITVANANGPSGDYSLTVAGEGGVVPQQTKPLKRKLAPGDKAVLTLPLLAKESGSGRVLVTLEGPQGVKRAEEVRMSVFVKAATLSTESKMLAAAGKENLAPLKGEDRGVDRVALGVGEVPDFGLAENLLKLLTARPAGVTELASGLLALHKGRDFILSHGLWDERSLRLRQQDWADRLVALQADSGGFSAKTGAAPDLLTTALALDALDQTRMDLVDVSASSTRQGLSWLNMAIEGDWFDPSTLQGRAYAVFVLAKGGVRDVATAHYLNDNVGAQLPDDATRAYLAAAFRVLNAPAPAEALEKQMTGSGDTLRQKAISLALSADDGFVRRQADGVQAMVDADENLSLQNRFWLLLAGLRVQKLPQDIHVTTQSGVTIQQDRAWYGFFESARSLPDLTNQTGHPLRLSILKSRGR
jgi:alpha-2-macroglobulin